MDALGGVAAAFDEPNQALLLVNGLSRWLERFGLGRLPGDFRFKLFGREMFLPVASTVLLSMVAALIAKFV